MLIRKAPLFFLSFLSLPALLKAESEDFFSTSAAPEGGFNYFSEFLNMLMTLGILLALIFVSVWALKRLMRSRAKQLNHANGIKILERRSLGQKSSIYVVDILGKGVVIGESQAGLNLITEFPEGTNLEELLESEVSPPPSKNPFSSLLKRKKNKAEA